MKRKQVVSALFLTFFVFFPYNVSGKIKSVTVEVNNLDCELCDYAIGPALNKVNINNYSINKSKNRIKLNDPVSDTGGFRYRKYVGIARTADLELKNLHITVSGTPSLLPNSPDYLKPKSNNNDTSSKSDTDTNKDKVRKKYFETTPIVFDSIDNDTKTTFYLQPGSEWELEYARLQKQLRYDRFSGTVTLTGTIRERLINGHIILIMDVYNGEIPNWFVN